jgi:hypothetical protein
MVYLYVKEVLLLLSAWAAFIQIRYWYRWRVFRKQSLQNGLGEPPIVPNKLPWGIERFAFLVNGQMASTSPILSRFVVDLLSADQASFVGTGETKR